MIFSNQRFFQKQINQIRLYCRLVFVNFLEEKCRHRKYTPKLTGLYLQTILEMNPGHDMTFTHFVSQIVPVSFRHTKQVTTNDNHLAHFTLFTGSKN